MPTVFTEADYQAWVAKGLVVEPGRPQSAVHRHPWANRSKAGYRADLGHFCRSKWEANLARFYRFTGVLYFYEPCEFWFPVERGIRTYTPDFLILYKDGKKVIVEVKRADKLTDRKVIAKATATRKWLKENKLDDYEYQFWTNAVIEGFTKLLEAKTKT